MTVTLLQDHPRFSRSELAKILIEKAAEPNSDLIKIDRAEKSDKPYKPELSSPATVGSEVSSSSPKQSFIEAQQEAWRRSPDKANLHGLHRDIADELDTTWFMQSIIFPISQSKDMIGKIAAMVCRISVMDAVAAKGGLQIGVDEKAVHPASIRPDTTKGEGVGDESVPLQTLHKDILITVSTRLFRTIFNEVHAGRAGNARILAETALNAAIQDNFLRGLRQDENSTPEEISFLTGLTPDQMSQALTSIMPVKEEVRKIVAQAPARHLSLVSQQKTIHHEADEGRVESPLAKALRTPPANSGHSGHLRAGLPTLH